MQLYNRTLEKAQKLTQEFNLFLGGTINDFKEKDYDILINATSCGYLNYNESILEKNKLIPNQIVFDVITKRIETQFLKYAKELGCQTIPRYKMLILQAEFPFKLFTGVQAPIKIMEKKLVEELLKNE